MTIDKEELVKLLRDPFIIRTLHEVSDFRDPSPNSLHHTLGDKRDQAAPGDHNHNAYIISGTLNAAMAVITTTETVITNLNDFVIDSPSDGARFLVLADIFWSSSVVNDQIRITLRDGGESAPTNTSTLLQSSYASEAAGASRLGHDKLMWEGTLTKGRHRLGLFALRSNGTGNITVGSATAGAISRAVILVPIKGTAIQQVDGGGGVGFRAGGGLRSAIGGDLVNASTATNTGSLTVGDNSSNTGAYGTALGSSAIVSAAQGTAVGYGSEAAGADSTALGYGSYASHSGSTVLGEGASSKVANGGLVKANVFEVESINAGGATFLILADSAGVRWKIGVSTAGALTVVAA